MRFTLKFTIHNDPKPGSAVEVKVPNVLAIDIRDFAPAPIRHCVSIEVDILETDSAYEKLDELMRETLRVKPLR